MTLVGGLSTLAILGPDGAKGAKYLGSAWLRWPPSGKRVLPRGPLEDAAVSTPFAPSDNTILNPRGFEQKNQKSEILRIRPEVLPPHCQILSGKVRPVGIPPTATKYIEASGKSSIPSRRTTFPTRDAQRTRPYEPSTSVQCERSGQSQPSGS